MSEFEFLLMFLLTKYFQSVWISILNTLKITLIEAFYFKISFTIAYQRPIISKPIFHPFSEIQTISATLNFSSKEDLSYWWQVWFGIYAIEDLSFDLDFISRSTSYSFWCLICILFTFKTNGSKNDLLRCNSSGLFK